MVSKNVIFGFGIGLLMLMIPVYGLDEYSSLEVLVEQTVPVQIYPGDSFDLYLRIYNTGTSSVLVKDVEVALPEGFSVISRYPQNIDTNLCGGCSLQVRYTIKANTISPDSYTFEFKVLTSDYTFTQPYNLKVYGDESILISSEKSEGYINGEGILKLTLKNVGDVDLNDIKLFLNNTNVFLKDVSYVYINDLSKGQEVSIDVPVLVDKTLKEGTYPLSLVVSYRGLYNEISRYVVGFNVISNAELEVASISLSDLPTVSKYVDLMMRIENYGYGKANDVYVVISSDDVVYVQNISYIGSLGSEEDSIAVFKIMPLSTDNKIHYEVHYLKGSQEIVKEGVYYFNAQQPKSNYLKYLVVLIIIALITGMYFYHKKFKKK